MRDEITYTFPNFNGASVEVWEWKSNFVPDVTGLGLKLIHGCKRGSIKETLKDMGTYT